jgi:uncharacterized protein (TIGR00251 family)
LSDRPLGARLSVHVKPRASRTGIVGVRDGALCVAVAAPPVEGEANAALARALADVLHVPLRDVVVVAGQASKRKIVDVCGIDASTVRERLGKS